MLSEITLPPDAALGEGPAAPVSCPECGRVDRIERVQSIVRRGSGHLFSDAGGEMVFVSDLARTLSAPERPHVVSLQRALAATIASWLTGAIFLLIFAGLGAQNLLTVPDAAIGTGRLATWAWFGATIPLVAFSMAVLNRQQLSQRLPEWQSAIERWSQLYYCSRDDVVFLPLLQEPVSPDRIEELLMPRLLSTEALS